MVFRRETQATKGGDGMRKLKCLKMVTIKELEMLIEKRNGAVSVTLLFQLKMKYF